MKNKFPLYKMNRCEKGTPSICKIYRPRSDRAFCASLPDPKQFSQSSAYQWTDVPDELFGIMCIMSNVVI